jgi:hypothetical protein
MKKYYLLKRNNVTLLNDYICELPKQSRNETLEKTSYNHNLILIEKSCPKHESEFVSNVWTMNEGVPSLWQIYTKGRETYDYTGIVHPLIHLNGTVKLFRDHFYKEETKF